MGGGLADRVPAVEQAPHLGDVRRLLASQQLGGLGVAFEPEAGEVDEPPACTLEPKAGGPKAGPLHSAAEISHPNAEPQEASDLAG
jgi:hypothetical protein